MKVFEFEKKKRKKIFLEKRSHQNLVIHVYYLFLAFLLKKEETKILPKKCLQENFFSHISFLEMDVTTFGNNVPIDIYSQSLFELGPPFVN